MLVDNISKEYYYHKNSEIIRDVDLMRGDCFPLNTYIVLKHKYTQLDNIYKLIIDDINFWIALGKNGKINYIGYKNNSMIENDVLIYSSQEYIRQGARSIEALEKFLDKDKFVMIQTINEWLPFSIHYNPNYKFDKITPGHIQIMIGYDEKQFYFVEDPALINYDKFNAFSKDVGMLDRTEALRILGTYLKCIDVRIDTDKYKMIDSLIFSIIKKSCRTYKKSNTYDSGGCIYLYGRNAINCLIDISKQEYINLNEIDKNLGPMNLFLRWKFRAIKNKRHTLFLFFKYFEKKYFQTKVTSLLKKDYDAWDKIWIIFEKKFAKKEYIWDRHLAKYFENVLGIEDELFNSIEQSSFWSRL